MYETFIESVPLLKSLEVSFIYFTSIIHFIIPHYSSPQQIEPVMKCAPHLTLSQEKEKETCLIEKEMAQIHSFFFAPGNGEDEASRCIRSKAVLRW